MLGTGTGGDAPDRLAIAIRNRRGLLAAGVVLVLVMVGTGVMAVPPLITYLSGTPATAHVDACRTHTSSGRHNSSTTTCYGTWTLNGTRHSGEIQGATDTDEGKDIPVHATEDGAATGGTLTTTWITLAALIGVCVVAIRAVR